MKNVHRIAIPTILEVGSKKLTQPGYLLNKHKLKKVVLFFCEGIYELFGQIIEESLSAYSEVEVIEKFTSKDNNICSIMKSAFAIPAEAEAIIGIGGGKILDIAKYTAFLVNLPFVSVPAKPSNDGFASSGCSLNVDRGKKDHCCRKNVFRNNS